MEIMLKTVVQIKGEACKVFAVMPRLNCFRTINLILLFGFFKFFSIIAISQCSVNFLLYFSRCSRNISKDLTVCVHVKFHI